MLPIVRPLKVSAILARSAAGRTVGEMTLRPKPRAVRTALLIGCSAVAIVACSSSSSRGAFDDDTSNDTTAPPPSSPEPPPQHQPQSGPVTPDGGTAPAPDASDDCKKVAPSNKCGLVPQCGCSAAETCDVVDSTGNVACIAAGKAPMGQSCTSTAGCAAGLTCVFGTCHAFCDAPGSACGTTGTGDCVDVKMEGGASVPNLDVCLVSCALQDANACGGTTAAGTAACVVDDTGKTDCQSWSGTLKENATCTPEADCAPGLVCVGPGGGAASSCKKWCRVGTSDCGAGKTCGGFATKLMVGTVEYGACP
jgi:hypothetical protein